LPVLQLRPIPDLAQDLALYLEPYQELVLAPDQALLRAQAQAQALLRAQDQALLLVLDRELVRVQDQALLLVPDQDQDLVVIAIPIRFLPHKLNLELEPEPVHRLPPTQFPPPQPKPLPELELVLWLVRPPLELELEQNYFRMNPQNLVLLMLLLLTLPLVPLDLFAEMELLNKEKNAILEPMPSSTAALLDALMLRQKLFAGLQETSALDPQDAS